MREKQSMLEFKNKNEEGDFNKKKSGEIERSEHFGRAKCFAFRDHPKN